MAGQTPDFNGHETTPENTDTECTEESTITSEDYEVLDSKLDDLNFALDFLEKKNDDIHAQLKELLQSNREIRQQLNSENPISVPSTENSN